MTNVRQKGYTILEVLIVVGVSAAMFVAASVAFAGRQQEVQFTQAIRDFDSRLQDTMNDVSTGYFYNPGSSSCLVDANNPNAFPVVSGGTDAQGTSEDCIFVGKAIQFDPEGLDPDKVNVFSVIGRRESNQRPVNNLLSSKPVALLESSALSLEWGLRITRIYSGGVDYGTIGFFTTFSQTFTSAQTTTYVSNNQSVRFMAIPGTAINDTAASTSGAISSIAAEPINEPVTICLQKADESKRAAIVLGGNKSTATSVEIDTYDRSICGA